MTSKDIPDVFKLMCDEGREAIKKNFTESLSHGVIPVIAQVNRLVVGYIIYRRGPLELEILDLVIGAQHRLLGFGRQLIQATIDKYKRASVKQIVTVVPELNVGLCIFLNKCGFQAQAPLLKGHFGDHDGIRMIYFFEEPHVT